MDILYFGSLCDDEIYKRKMTHHEPFFLAQYSYEQALCKELSSASNMCLEFITIYQTQYFPKDRFFCCKGRKSGSSYKMLSFLNLPYLRELSYFISAFMQLAKWSVLHRKSKEKCVYASTHFTPVSLAIVCFTKLFHIKRFITFTDLSSFTFQEARIRQMPLYKRMVIKPYVKLTELLQQSYDGYILFTEAMNAVVNPFGKPYCVVEGIYNDFGLNHSKAEKKDAVAHAGTLSHLVGIRDIIAVHEKLDLSTELWFMGDGDMKEEILARSEEDPRIKYLGFLPRVHVFEILKAARLLLILRNPADIYTRYSFPSKLFEYMASGTPVFTSYLQGIPEEYYQYLYTSDSSDIDKISMQIRSILSMPQEELDKMGKRARDFVLEQKNASKQGEKVRNFLLKYVLDTSRTEN